MAKSYNLLDSKAEADLVKAFFYMNTFENRYCGSRVSCDQTGAFPRNDLQINSCIIPSNSIPNAVKHAQIYAAYEESQGIALQSNSSGRSVVSESIDGCLSVTYSDNGQIEDKNILTRVQNALALLLSTGFGYTVSRG